MVNKKSGGLFAFRGNKNMKIESVHNKKTPGYAVAAVVLSAAMILGGCTAKTSETTEVQLEGKAQTIDTEAPDPSDYSDYSDYSETDNSDNKTDDTDPVKDTESLDDIGENYFKEADPDDIVYDEETGLIYVKNQLLVSCKLGTSREEMEDVCEEIGAEIVGYTEITSDFQIEFKEDKTLDDLDEIGDYLYGYPFVSAVFLNTAFSTVPEEE